MKADEKVTARMIGFIAKIQDETDKYYAEHLKNSVPAVLSFKEGGKFFKVNTCACGSTSVYCFVDKLTGDIYKAANWAAPAKHIRGSIFDENNSTRATTTAVRSNNYFS